jgi:hypothetical protein
LKQVNPVAPRRGHAGPFDNQAAVANNDPSVSLSAIFAGEKQKPNLSFLEVLICSANAVRGLTVSTSGKFAAVLLRLAVSLHRGRPGCWFVRNCCTNSWSSCSSEARQAVVDLFLRRCRRRARHLGSVERLVANYATTDTPRSLRRFF